MGRSMEPSSWTCSCLSEVTISHSTCMQLSENGKVFGRHCKRALVTTANLHSGHAAQPGRNAHHRMCWHVCIRSAASMLHVPRPIQEALMLQQAPTRTCATHNGMYAPLHTRENREVVDEPIDEGPCIAQQETFVCQPHHPVPTKDRSRSDGRIGAGPGHHGFVKKGGRPVTWIGGGGLDPKRLVNMGVPQLRTLFQEVFGEATASNNAAWLRRKLSENPDSMYGQGRCATVRARDASAAIWTHPHHTTSMHQPSCSSQGGSGQATHTHLGGGSGSGASPTDSHSSGSGGDASYMATTTSVRRRPVKRNSSLRDTDFSSSSARPRSHHAGGGGGGGGGGGKRVPITRTSFSLRYLGGNVEVYWPDDNTWWAATVLQVDTEEPRLQLLYSNLQQEDITGQDLWDMMDAGHLVEGYAVRSRPAKQPSRRKLDAPAGSPTKRHHAGGANYPASHAAADAGALAASEPVLADGEASMKRQSSSGSGQAGGGTWVPQQQVPRGEEDNNDPMEWLAEFSICQQKALSGGSSGEHTATLQLSGAAEGGGGAYSSSRQQQKQANLVPCAFQQVPAGPLAGWSNGNPVSVPPAAADGMGVSPWGPSQLPAGGYPDGMAAASAAVAAGGADLSLLTQLLGPLTAAAAVAGRLAAEDQQQQQLAALQAPAPARPPPQQQQQQVSHNMPGWMVSLGLGAPQQPPAAEGETPSAGLPAWAMPVATGGMAGRSHSAPVVNDIIAEAALMLRQSSAPSVRRAGASLPAALAAAAAADPGSSAFCGYPAAAGPSHKVEPELGMRMVGLHPAGAAAQVAQVFVLPCGAAGGGRAASPALDNLQPDAPAAAGSGGSLGSPRAMDTGVLDSDDVLPAHAGQADYISGEEESEGEQDAMGRGVSEGPLAGPSSSSPSSYGEDDLDTLLSKPPGGDFGMSYGMEGAAGGGAPRYCNNSALQEVGLMSELFSI